MLELTMWKCASHSENKDKINVMLASMKLPQFKDIELEFWKNIL